MTPMLGIMASQISGHLTAYAYDSIQTVTVGSGGSGTFTFSSIPQTYTHLQIRWLARTNRANAQDGVYLQFNSVTTGNAYVIHYLYGTGAATGSVYEAAANSMHTYSIPGASASANMFGAGVCDILDYTNTNKYKTVRTLSGDDENGAGELELNSGLFMATNAISSITVIPGNGTLFAQYSSFALYGIK